MPDAAVPPASWLARRAVPLALILGAAALAGGAWLSSRSAPDPARALAAAEAAPFAPAGDPAARAAFARGVWEAQQLDHRDPQRLVRCAALLRAAKRLDAAAVAEATAELARCAIDDGLRQRLRLRAADLLVGQGRAAEAFRFLAAQATAADTLHHRLDQAIELRLNADGLAQAAAAGAVTPAERIDNRRRLAGALLERGNAAGALGALPTADEGTSAGEAPEVDAIWRGVIASHQPGAEAPSPVVPDDPALLARPHAPLVLLARGYVLDRAGAHGPALAHLRRALAVMQVRARDPAALAGRLAAGDLDREALDRADLDRRLESSRSGIHQSDAVKRRVYDWARRELAALPPG